MKKIALTGGIAEGKSTVLSYIEKIGIPTLSADQIAKEILEEKQTQELILKQLHLQPPFSRTTLRECLLSSHQSRHAINQILHPLILKRLLTSPQQVLEIPLLIETCTYGLFDRVWVVTCGLEEQKRRLEKRFDKPEIVEAFLRTQLPTAVKCVFADQIFFTNQPEEKVNERVHKALKEEGLY